MPKLKCLLVQAEYHCAYRPKADPGGSFVRSARTYGRDVWCVMETRDELHGLLEEQANATRSASGCRSTGNLAMRSKQRLEFDGVCMSVHVHNTPQYAMTQWLFLLKVLWYLASVEGWDLQSMETCRLTLSADHPTSSMPGSICMAKEKEITWRFRGRVNKLAKCKLDLQGSVG